jgi:hypothetical protein
LITFLNMWERGLITLSSKFLHFRPICTRCAHDAQYRLFRISEGGKT